MIDVKNLCHDYEGKGQLAVNHVTFHIEKGQIFGFLGPSGAGKSTVQNIMTGLLNLQQGEISYEGQDIRTVRTSFFNTIGVSFEHPYLYTKLSGYENLKYYAGLFDVRTEDPLKLLDKVGLGQAAHKSAGSYSKGMKQRLVFARALLNNPRILFLDEPLSGLDPATAKVIKDIIQDKSDSGTTIFLTTHNMYVADELCHQVAFLHAGKIVAMDTPRDLKLRYGERSVKVEYLEKNKVHSEILFTDQEKDKKQLQKLLDEKTIQTIHSQEASLEQIFIKMTGRGLS